MVLCGDHLSLQAGCSCGWHALWEEQGMWEASTLSEYGVGEAVFPQLMPSSTSSGSILAYHLLINILTLGPANIGFILFFTQLHHGIFVVGDHKVCLTPSILLCLLTLSCPL